MISGNAPTGFTEPSRAFDPHSVLQKWGYTTIVCSAGIRVDKKPLSGEEGKVRDTWVICQSWHQPMNTKSTCLHSEALYWC